MYTIIDKAIGKVSGIGRSRNQLDSILYNENFMSKNTNKKNQDSIPQLVYSLTYIAPPAKIKTASSGLRFGTIKPSKLYKRAAWAIANGDQVKLSLRLFAGKMKAYGIEIEEIESGQASKESGHVRFAFSKDISAVYFYKDDPDSIDVLTGEASRMIFVRKGIFPTACLSIALQDAKRNSTKDEYKNSPTRELTNVSAESLKESAKAQSEMDSMIQSAIKAGI